MKNLQKFNKEQIKIVNNAAFFAEELVSDAYKMSASQWIGKRYDIKTLEELSLSEIVHGPFAQIIRYQGKPNDSFLSSSVYDFYKICLQDHTILSVLGQQQDIKMFPFILYAITHELIHIVRFNKFLQSFDASEEEKLQEEIRVHSKTRDILENTSLTDISVVLKFYDKWVYNGDSKFEF